MTTENVFSPADFVAVLNQSLEYAYPSVLIEGELANLRVSKGRWLYFDLKDDYASVKFFGSVSQLPGPLEDGLMLQVRGLPRLHPLYGFSVNVQFMQAVGEGSIRKAAELLQAKLAAEGLFEPQRKRQLPYPPQRIGLIASSESAAYRDFLKVLGERWGGIDIELANVQVQGEAAAGQIVKAVEYFNSRADSPDVLVLTRGGGSPEDLAAFSSEAVVRAVAASRIPTLAAIGHERDVALAELAADRRASTPSNAAELLVPERRQAATGLIEAQNQLAQAIAAIVAAGQADLEQAGRDLSAAISQQLQHYRHNWQLQADLLAALSPQAALRRGYALVRHDGRLLRHANQAKAGDELEIELQDGRLSAKVLKRQG